MPTPTITVFLSPNQKFKGKPDPAWLKPQGVQLRLTNTGGGPPDDLAATNRKGVTSAAPLTIGDSYNVAIRGKYFNDWTANVVQIGAGDTEVVLTPKGDQWSLPLLLFRYDDTGKRIGIPDAKVELKGPGGKNKSFRSRADGSVYATRPAGDVQVEPQRIDKLMPAQSGFVVRTQQAQEPIMVEYRAMSARITIRPEVKLGGQVSAIPGVTFELSRDDQEKPLTQVSQGSQACVFSNLPPGQVTVRVVPPAQYNGSPIELVKKMDCVPVNLAAGDDVDLSRFFLFKYPTGRIRGRVVDGEGKPLNNIQILASSNGQSASKTTGKKGTYSISGLKTGAWTLMLDQSTVRVGGETLMAQPEQQLVTVQADKTTKASDFELEPDEHGIRGNVTDSTGKPVPYAIIEIRDQQMRVIDKVVADEQGAYQWRSPSSGMFVVNLLTRDGRTVQRETVTVNSWAPLNLIATDLPDGSAPQGPGQNGSGSNQPGGGAASGGPAVREAVTDLAAYPVLTEEVSTTGAPAPVAGGTGGGTAGAGYGQIVDQAMRDVLGWRPGGDLSGFQAALTGAFQLREVEGHTEWTWQQRGYAVQADMGALTGAQASIYARAKAALDQMQPLLAGVTALNPTLYPPEDLEAIRTVITVELQELVKELALEGGPRIQRVDELFRLLIGESRRSFDSNPDDVQGQLGTMRDRFGLTEEWVDTVDQERILTNFRVVVEQVLSLQESWFYDRKLLSAVDSRSSLGTILIWLSRGLEAVCESVDDLTFALDSVYIDAAQRQVIELRLPHQPVLSLSDLLDWVVLAARDQGPRLIQDAGRDGVDAFAPQLQELQGLIQQTRTLIRTPGSALPDGMRTPRVHRAFQVVEAQLTEASRLAGLVQRQSFAQGPQITSAVATPPSGGQITVAIAGTNFGRHASAALLPQDREDIAELPARHTTVRNPSSAIASFPDPSQVPNSLGVTWQVLLTNEDGTRSNMAAI